jgi:ribose transport system permease protein
VIGTFVGCGVLTGFGGILLAAQLGSGQPSIGNSYLLPALVGALLGSTALQPGRANAWGTIVAVVTLAVGISGLEQLGAHFFIDPLFNGFTLLIAVGIAGFATRNRRQARIGLARRGGGGGGAAATEGDADPPPPLNGSGALSSGALPSSAPSSGAPPPSGAPPGAATT